MPTAQDQWRMQAWALPAVDQNAPTSSSTLLRATAGSAAAGIVIVGSLLSVVVMGMLETGNYLLSQRVVLAAVRDATQYAASEPLAASACGAPMSPKLVEKVRNVALTGQAAAGGQARLAGWTDSNTVRVSLDCRDVRQGRNDPGVATRVKVVANVPYSALFGAFRLDRNFALRAEFAAPAKGL